MDPRDKAAHEEALKRFGGKMPEGDPAAEKRDFNKRLPHAVEYLI